MAHDVFTVHVDSNNNNKMSKWKEEQERTKKKNWRKKSILWAEFFLTFIMFDGFHTTNSDTAIFMPELYCISDGK